MTNTGAHSHIELQGLDSGHSLWVVDDFFQNLQEIRDQTRILANDAFDYSALQFFGLPTRAFSIASLNEALSGILGHPYNFTSRFQYSFEEHAAANKVHFDQCDYAGLVYLGDAPSPRSGTAFYRHRATGLVSIDDLPRLNLSEDDENHLYLQIKDQGRDAAAWEKILCIPYRCNRAVLFSGNLFHAADSFWGDNRKNGRLVLTYYTELHSSSVFKTFMDQINAQETGKV